MIVHLAYEYHLAPSVLLAESDRMLWTMHRYLRWRQVEMNKGRKR